MSSDLGRPPLTATCPRCARPVAAAQPRCVYCGAELPPDAVEAASAARAALEAEWAREGGAGMGGTVDAALGGGASPLPEASGAGTASPRILIVLELEGADEGALARALGLSAFEAQQRRRRAGPDLHRILPAPEAAAEAARLRAHGLDVLELAEEEVRRAEPVPVTRGTVEGDGLVLHGDEGPVRLVEDDVLLIVRGPIAREYPPSGEVRRVRIATLEPGYRVHLHRRSDPRPIELDPAAFDFGPGGGEGSAQGRIAAWIDRVFPRVPRDDSFRLAIPALAPAAPAAGGGASAGEAMARPGRDRRPVLDNAAQFRFHSAWRAAARRRAR